MSDCHLITAFQHGGRKIGGAQGEAALLHIRSCAAPFRRDIPQNVVWLINLHAFLYMEPPFQIPGSTTVMTLAVACIVDCVSVLGPGMEGGGVGMGNGD